MSTTDPPPTAADPIRLSEPIVAVRLLAREYLVMSVIAAAVIAIAVDDGGFVAVVMAVVIVAFLAVALLAALPLSNRLTVDAAGLRLRTFLVFTRVIPWSAVGAVDVVEGWAGETVAIDVDGPAGRGVIIGLPIDPGLGRRAFASTYGRSPAAFRDLLVRRRAAAHP